jgi:hypothetical protein
MTSSGILGGAARQRCDKHSLIHVGSSPRGVPDLRLRDRKQPKPQHSPIPLKVAVSCKNVPLPPRHRTNQESNRRARDSTSPAPTMRVRCFLMVSNVNSRLINSPQIIPQRDKLFFLANAREQLLRIAPIICTRPSRINSERAPVSARSRTSRSGALGRAALTTTSECPPKHS